MTALWTAADAAAATGGTAQGDWSAKGVSIDTRTIQSGDLFVALKDVRDGHDFVAQALEKGAAAAMVSRVPEALMPNSIIYLLKVLSYRRRRPPILTKYCQISLPLSSYSTLLHLNLKKQEQNPPPTDRSFAPVLRCLL